MRLLFAISLCCALLLNSRGQDDVSEFEYKHMTGNLGPYELICDLHISGNEINGNVFSPGRTIVDSLDNDFFNWRLEGSKDEYGITDLEAYDSNIPAGRFSGSLSETYRGTHRPPGSEMVRSFLLTEDYTDAIAFGGYSISADSVLFDSVNSPTAKLNISILLPLEGDSFFYIRESILSAFFGKDHLSEYPDDSILLIYADMYFKKYIESNIDIYDGGYSFNWEMIGNSSIMLNRKGILCYRADSYAYTGGAHGMGISRLLVFDTRAKTRILLKDLFIENSDKELGKLLEKKYRKMRFLDDDESLTDAGLFDENIHATENFQISDNGITFIYNPYELAPYAMGSITISLPYSDIQDLIRDDSPVRKLGL